MSFFTGFGVSAFVYFSLNFLVPSVGSSKVFEEVDDSEFELVRPSNAHDLGKDDDSKDDDSLRKGSDKVQVSSVHNHV